MQLDKETRRKLKLFKRAQKIQRKLVANRHTSTKQQRDSWKWHIAKALRTFPTDAEAKLWPYLQTMQFSNQHQLYGYIVDFAHLESKVIIELDGEVHKKDSQAKYDKNRDQVFWSRGWNVIRFENDAIKSPVGLELVLKAVRMAIDLKDGERAEHESIRDSRRTRGNAIRNEDM